MAKTTLRKFSRDDAPASNPQEIAAPAPQPERRPARPVERPQATHRPLDEADLLSLAQMDKAAFEAMLGGNMKPLKLEVGSRVSGVVTRVTRETVFVDVGSKSEGLVEIIEAPSARVGEPFTGYVIAVDELGVRLSQRLSGQAASAFIDSALDSGMPVTGKVVSRNPGGFEVKIGHTSAFCPISRIARIMPEDLDAFVGRELDFQVIETGDKIVLSRRALEEAQLDTGAVWQRLEVDQVVDGVVASIRPFGLFIDLQGVQGLLPSRELGWGDSGEAASAYKKGQTLSVRVIDLNRDTKKITLSLRNPALNPWNRVESDFVSGGTYTGTVARITDFGAFITLAPGLDGLLHKRHIKAELSVGAAIEVTLASVDTALKRMELVPAGAEVAPRSAPPPSAALEGTVVEVLQNGLLVELPDGQTGWLAAREVDLPAGTILPQRFRRGGKVTVRVLRKDAKKGGQPVLTTRLDGGDEGSWRAEQSQGKQTFGTLGDLFKGIKL